MSTRVTIYHIFLVAVVLGAFITLFTSFFLVRKEAGVNYYGFPVAWKSVYGGVSARYNLTNFVIDILFWILVTYPMLILLFSALGWKQS
jgi:hypothetical protein